MTMFPAERLRIMAWIEPALKGDAWALRWQVEAYVHKCVSAGFVKTPDDAQNCATRYLAGKRKVTPPGTKRRKRAAKEMAKVLKNVPAELTIAIDEVIVEQAKAVEQFRNGNEKVINSLVGAVMKKMRFDAAIVRTLLLNKLKE